MYLSDDSLYGLRKKENRSGESMKYGEIKKKKIQMHIFMCIAHYFLCIGNEMALDGGKALD